MYCHTWKYLRGERLGAALVCAFLLFPVQSGLLRFLLLHLSVNTVMIWTGLKIREPRQYLKAFAVLYASAFLMGGVFTWLRPYVRTGSLFSEPQSEAIIWCLESGRCCCTCREPADTGVLLQCMLLERAVRCRRFSIRKQSVRSGHRQAGLYPGGAGRRIFSGAGISDAALYTILFGRDKSRRAAGGKAGKNVYPQRAGNSGGTAAHRDM